MPGKRSSKSDSELSQTKERILRSAAAKFSEKGYRGASIRMISSAADVNVAAVNYYFGSKEQLYFETYRYVIEAAQNTESKWYRQPLPEFNSIDEWLAFTEGIVRRVFQYTLKKDKISNWRRKMCALELAQPSGVLKLLLENYYQLIFDYLCKLFLEVMKPMDEHELHILVQVVLDQMLMVDRLVPPWDQLILYRDMSQEEWVQRKVVFIMDLIKSKIPNKE